MGKIVQTAGKNTLGEFAPEFAHFNDDVLFGENWNNQDIDVKTRSIITVVALTASGITDSSLKYHLQNAKNHGVTQKEIAAVITHVAFYAGWPKAWAVFNLAKEVWEAGEGDFYICISEFTVFHSALLILIQRTLSPIPPHTTHWNNPLPAPQLPDGKTIHPERPHASALHLPEC